ncbi:hypothetical protein [Pantoea sp. CS_6]|uniref:hypothetical protein n=1 Tax=Pantoea sp. CS_6 TaxID=3055795 RepID=UPI0035BF6DE3
MLEIAKHLNAQVMDDDGAIYSDESQWEYDPSANAERPLLAQSGHNIPQEK